MGPAVGLVLARMSGRPLIEGGKGPLKLSAKIGSTEGGLSSIFTAQERRRFLRLLASAPSCRAHGFPGFSHTLAPQSEGHPTPHSFPLRFHS